jgi:hypothetical protein
MHLQTFSDYTIVHGSFLEEEGIELEWTIVAPERTRVTKQWVVMEPSTRQC